MQTVRLIVLPIVMLIVLLIVLLLLLLLLIVLLSALAQLLVMFHLQPDRKVRGPSFDAPPPPMHSQT